MVSSPVEELRVLVVDDSAVVREALGAVLSQEPGVSVVTAADPIIAMIKMARQRPDVVILDLELPRMSGLTFLKKIMRENPLPVVVCSAHVGDGAASGIEALDAGAVDLVAKPKIGVRDFLYESVVVLIDAVRAAAKAGAKIRARGRSALLPAANADAVLPVHPASPPSPGADHLIAVGASTGGTEGLRMLLEMMPPDAPGIVVVQHMPEGFTSAFANRLNRTCGIRVKEAVQGDPIVSGRALIAPGNLHLLVRRRNESYLAEVVDGPLVSRHRPSVDVLFRSVALAAGPQGIGVIMTGMGSDGAQGLLEMRQAGALTLAQDEETCVVFGMSKEAIDRGAACRVVPLDRLADAILTGVGYRRHRNAASAGTCNPEFGSTS